MQYPRFANQQLKKWKNKRSPIPCFFLRGERTKVGNNVASLHCLRNYKTIKAKRIYIYIFFLVIEIRKEINKHRRLAIFCKKIKETLKNNLVLDVLGYFVKQRRKK